jgi:predicted secreted protein
VSRTSDPRDVFAVSLNAGERLVVSLTGADGTNFDTALYPPGTGSVLTGVPVAESAWDQYPETFYFDCEVGEAGTYCLEVEAYAGSGGYTLEWAVQASPSGPDDDIPGVAMPSPSPAAGFLNAYSDADDVYAINLSAGQRLTLTLDGAPGLDADLYVFRPTASGIYDDIALTGSATDSYPEYAVLDVGVGRGGTYYVDVSAASGSGTYSLDYKVTSVGPPPDDVPGVP